MVSCVTGKRLAMKYYWLTGLARGAVSTIGKHTARSTLHVLGWDTPVVLLYSATLHGNFHASLGGTATSGSGGVGWLFGLKHPRTSIAATLNAANARL